MGVAMTINDLLIIINSVAGLVIFSCVGYQVVRHQFTDRKPRLIAYALLAGGSIWILASHVQGIAHDAAEVMTNVGIAILLALETIRDLLADIQEREANESTE